MVCNTDVIIVGPPGLPKIIDNSSFSSIIVGVIELNILFSGSIALISPPIKPYMLGKPGFIEKSSISLLKKNPNSSEISFEP